MEQFTALAGSLKGKAVAAMIQQVLNHKKIFTFGELLEVPSIVQLKDTEGCESAHATLNLFAFGVYRDYLSERSKYLPLTDYQVQKLRQLTLVSLCEQHSSVSYAMLQHELDIDNARQLEDLLIETTYLGLIQGKIDQKGATFLVTARVSGRDVRPEEVDAIIQKLTVWRQKTAAVGEAVQASTASLRTRKSEEVIAAAELQARVDRVKEAVKLAHVSSEGGSGGGGGAELQAGSKPKRTRGGVGDPGYF
jgi:COP9 signalosome complex subunit 7